MKTRMFSFAVIGLIVMLTCCGRRGEQYLTTSEIDAHISFLSHDLLEGRGVGSRGLGVAALYHESLFRQWGLQPVFKSSYRQKLTLRGSRPDDKASLEFTRGNFSLDFKPAEDFVIGSNREDCPEGVEGEVVYVGYLVQAPERHWDDVKDADLKGKVLLCEINEPGNFEGGDFEGEDLTIYGRWTYKLEKAAELGATGILIVHNPAGAGYGWEVVRNSWTRERFFLPGETQRLFFQGWMSPGAAEAVFEAAGLNHASLLAKAETESFTPVPTGLNVRVRQKPSFRSVSAVNIVGMVPRKGQKPSDRNIILTAHYDHIGIDRKREGDKIFNGAVDNCSASAAMLALAHYYAENPRRAPANLVFAAVTAEEEGLLGSEYLARNLPFPKSSVLASLNFEMTNVWGEVEDVYAIGAKHSDLDDFCRRAAEKMKLAYIPEREGKIGYFFRSDQFSFIRNGIPAVWLHEGVTSRGKDKGYVLRMNEEYKKDKYHQVSDEIEPDWDLRGTAQIARWAREIIALLAEAEALPQFVPGSPFKRTE